MASAGNPPDPLDEFDQYMKGYLDKHPKVKEMYQSMSKLPECSIDKTEGGSDSLKTAHGFFEKVKKGMEIAGSDGAKKFLSDDRVKEALTEHLPKVAGQLETVQKIASVMGPAGSLLGAATGILTATGVVESEHAEVVRKLDAIIQTLDGLKDDIRCGFAEITALVTILGHYQSLKTTVEMFERNLQDVGAMRTLEKFTGDEYQRCKPLEIMDKLQTIHTIIAEGDLGSGMLFKKLANANSSLEGEKMDEFIAKTLLQFQLLFSLQIRALRMLRMIIAFRGEDLKYENDLKSIFEHLTTQRNKCDPMQYFEWYLSVKCLGGVVTMTCTPLAHFKDLKFGSRMIMTPNSNGTLLISTLTSPAEYLYMGSSFWPFNTTIYVSKNPGEQGRWIMRIKNFTEKLVTFSPKKWPNWYLFVSVDSKGGETEFTLLGKNDNKETGTHMAIGERADTPDWCSQFFTSGGKFVLWSAAANQESRRYIYCGDDGSVHTKSEVTGPPGADATLIFTPEVSKLFSMPVFENQFLISSKQYRKSSYMYMAGLGRKVQWYRGKRDYGECLWHITFNSNFSSMTLHADKWELALGAPKREFYLCSSENSDCVYPEESTNLKGEVEKWTLEPAKQ